MKVNGSTQIEVNISDIEAKRITLNFLYSFINLSVPYHNDHYYIDGNDNLIFESEYGHDQWTQDRVREASKLDHEILRVIHRIK